MAGHVEDRWWREKTDEAGEVVLNAKGKPVREKTDLYGKGMRYRVRYYVSRKERSSSFPDGKLRRAQAFLAKVQTDALTGTYVDPDAGKVRLRTYVGQYLKGQSENYATQRRYKSMLENMVFGYFDDPFLADITHDEVRNWLEWMRDKGGKRVMSATYRGQLFDMLSAILNAAVEEGLITVNPCKARSIKRPKVERRKIVPWPEEKMWAIRAALPEIYRIAIPLGAGLGLRQMELLAQSPEDIDRDRGEVNVVRQIKWIDKAPVFAPPKGGKPRVVPIGEGVLAAVDEHMATFEPVTVTLPWLTPGGAPETVRLLINKAADGRQRYNAGVRARLWSGDGFHTGVWRPAFTRAGLAYMKQWDGMHALRHLFASLMLEQGVSIKELSEYLGHHDPAFTLRIYTHMMPSSHQRARLASDKVFKVPTLANAA
ncbi:MAG: tyrosine-type recombinase/integrase [Actinophytocola sp.]|uniref:tyrosine-type recombinase/integrase n=1 Tax=Actinophytocola sp. TaxID=1872138 RepID=UPI003D6BC208